MSDESRPEYQLVKDKREEMQSIFNRMDVDEGLYFLAAYEMKKLPPNDTKKMDGVANVTLPDSQAFANKAKALLAGLDMQRIVEGDSTPFASWKLLYYA